MKKIIVHVLSILLILFVISVKSDAQAGTVMIGAKAWYLEWDSAFDKAIADALVKELNNTNPSQKWSANVKPGTGFLAGPLLGYQTDDNKWSFSSAFMFVNSFQTKSEWSESNVYHSVVGTKTTMDRKDIDLSVSYLLLDFMKVFAGFKYVTANYDVNFESDGSDFYNAKMTSKIPTAGIAVATSISENLVIGLQVGVMYIIPSYKMDGETVKADNSYGFTVEPNISYTITENFMIQLGIRYQIYNVKFTEPGWSVTKNDRLLGGTVSAVYLW